MGGYYEDADKAFCIFIIISRLADLEEAKIVFNSIVKFMRVEETSLFITKY